MPAGPQVIVAGPTNTELGNVNSFGIDGRVALATVAPATYPEPVSLTLTADATATGSNTVVTITTNSANLPIPLLIGQPLSFQTATATYTGIVTGANVAAGATTGFDITINETIPSGAVAEYPVRLEKMTQMNRTSATTVNSEADYDGRGASLQSTGETTQAFAITNNYNPYAVGPATVRAAQSLGLQVFIAQLMPSPDPVVFQRGEVDWGIGVVSQADRNSTVGSSVTDSLGVTISGSLSTESPLLV